jgi:hypothetical protein
MKKAQTSSGKRKLRGVMSTEYILVLAGVVIPLAMLVPMIVRMITTYGHRIFSIVALPFG